MWMDTVPISYFEHIAFEMLIFTSMESIFQKHLRAVTGGVSVPRVVYFSSWVSNSRLEAYLATRQVDSNVNDNEDDSEKGTAPVTTTTTTTTKTTTITTTAMILKAKLAYLLVAIVLFLNIYREISEKVRVTFCFHSPLAIETHLDTSLNMTVIDIKPQYQSYCHPPAFTFETTLWHHLPFLYSSHSSLRVILAHLSGLLFALAWSAIPTDIIITAWTQMWNSPSSYLRKIHYVLFMLPIKFLALVLIVRYTPKGDFSMGTSAVRAEYQMYWYFVFSTGTKLAFGLRLIWSLYVAHSNRNSRFTDCLEETKEMAKENENELLL